MPRETSTERVSSIDMSSFTGVAGEEEEEEEEELEGLREEGERAEVVEAEASSRRRDAREDFPWSTCAIMA